MNRTSLESINMKKIAAITALTAFALTGCAEDAGQDGEQTTAAHSEEKTSQKAQAEQEAKQAKKDTVAWVKDVFSIRGDWGDTADAAPRFADYVTGARLESGKIYVTMQVNRESDDDVAMAEDANRLLKNSAKINFPANLSHVDWIIVEDGTGTVVSQESIDA